MSFDADAYRDASRRQWQDAASGWIDRQQLIRDWGAPVSHWMVDAIQPQVGHRVLELAAGVGETGLLAAELVAPAGNVIISDQADGMLAGSHARAAELGIANIEFLLLSAEGIDLPLASMDAVLCRWGYMLLADPAAALAETRRVLRPRGRLALAVWDSAERNPWASLTTLELLERGLVTAPAPDAPGPFALGDRQRLAALLAEAGFVDARIEAIDLVRRHAGADEFWAAQLDLSPGLRQAVRGHSERELGEIRAGLSARLAPYIAPDGSVAIPARTLVASASA